MEKTFWPGFCSYFVFWLKEAETSSSIFSHFLCSRYIILHNIHNTSLKEKNTSLVTVGLQPDFWIRRDAFISGNRLSNSEWTETFPQNYTLVIKLYIHPAELSVRRSTGTGTRCSIKRYFSLVEYWALMKHISVIQ